MSGAHLIIAACAVLAAIALVASVRRAWAFLFVFLVLFPKMPLAVVPGNTTPLRVDDVVVGLVIGGWVLRRLIRPSNVPGSALTLPLAAYFTVALVSTLVGMGMQTTTVSAGTFHFLRLVEYGLLYFFFFDAIRSGELGLMLRTIAGTWLIVAAVWAVQHWTFEGSLNGPLGNWGTYAPSFGATYDFGGYVMMTTLVLYAAWVYGRVRTPFIGIALLMGVFVAINADSRASLVGLVAGLVIDVFLRLRLRAAVAVVTAAAATPFILHTTKMERLISTLASLDATLISREFLSDPSIVIRLRNWQAALDRWLESPLLGDGLGGYLQYVRIYNLPGTPDGWYVRVLAETGLVGLLAFVMLIGALLWVLLEAARREPRRVEYGILYGSALVVFAMCVNAFFIDTFVSFKMMSVFWMIVAAATRIEAETRAAAVVVIPDPRTMRPLQA